MKFLILFCFVSLASANVVNTKKLFKIPILYLNSWNKLVEPFRNECMSETGADELDTLNFFLNMKFPEKSSFKCYIKCLYLRLNMMDENGVVNVEEIASQVVGVDFEMVKGCYLGLRNVTDHCEKAYSGIMCGMDKISKLS
ncbi:hypothetical protein FQR65_LT01415 [Abscondita terminalis]|nr:hypothetical protein FQR65_LT01415 [Abscondita terminalis]